MKSKLLWIFLLLCPLFSFGTPCSGNASTPVYNGTGGLPVQYCLGESPTALSASSSTPGILKWFNEDGTPTNTPFGPWGAPTPTTTTAGTTTYKVVLVPSNPTLCTSDTLEIPVLVHDNPIITTSGITTICQGDGTVLSASGAGSGGSYFWNGGLVNNATVTFTPSTNTTYTVRGTDQFGCQGIANAVITVNPLPLPPTQSLLNQTQYCLGSTANPIIVNPSAGHTLKWYDNADNLLATGSAGPVPSTGTPGSTTYKVTQTNSTTLCESTPLLISITITTLPTISIIEGPIQPVCDGEPLTLTGTGAGSSGSYSWTPGISNGVPFTPTSNSIYTVTGIDVNGCSNAASTVVTINTPPTINAGSDVPVCAGQTVTLSGSGSGSSGSYSWSGGISDGVPFTPTTTTTYTVTGTDVNGCTNTDDVLVTVNALPTISVVGGASQTVCDGSPVILTGSGAGSGGSYSWSGGISNGVSFTPSSSSSYTVTGTDGNGCSSTATASVTVNTPPTINAGSDVEICAGETVTLSGSGAGTGGSYSWSGGISNGVSFTPTVTTTYTLTGTDANGCTGTDQVTVTVNAIPSAPTVDPSNTTQYCLGATASSMSAVSISGYTLKWYDNADNLLATGSTGPVPSTVASGSTTYKVTQTNGTTLCESSALLVTVTVNALPSISVVGGASQTVCDGSSITLNGDGGVSYSWSGVDVSGNAISNGASFVPPGSTTTTYTVTGTDGNGCSSTATASVTVNTPPTINAGSDVEICAGETVTLSGSGAGTGGSYSWSGGISNGVSFTPTVTTTYTLTGTDANGCTGTDQVTVTVNAIPSAPTVDPSNTTQYCLGATASSMSAVSISGYTLKWYDNADNLFSSSPTPLTSILGSTLYKVTQTDGNGCESSTLNITVTVNPLPTISVVGGASQTVCDGSPVILTGSGAGSGGSYSWSGGISNGVSFTPSSSSSYTVTGTDGNGCSSTATASVTVNTPPTINAGSDVEICAGETVTLSGSGAGTGGSYSWSGGISNGVSFTPTVTTTYTVTGTDANGCTGTDQVTVTVNAIPSAPTVDPSNTTQYCLGATASSMSAVSISGYTLKWYDNADNLLATGSTGPVPSTVASGSTTYKVTQTNGTTLCESSALLVTVTVNPLPTISVVGGASQTVCDGTSITLSGSGGVSYSWSGVDVSGNAISNGVSFVPPGSTTTTYTVTGTDGNGCSNTSNVDVTTTATAVISLSATPSIICPGESVMLTATGGTAYIWGPGVIVNTATPNQQTVVPTVTTTYTVTGTDASSASSCTGTDQVTVTVNAIPSAPTVDPSNTTQYCLGATASSMSAVSISGYTLKWYDNTDNLLATGSTGPVPSTVASGSTTYKVTQTNGTTLCESSALLVTVTVNPLPTISVVGGASQTVCDGSSITLNGDGGVSYSWSGVDASGNAISNGASFVPPGSTTTTYTVTGTDGNGCSSTSSINVISTALPTINATIANIYNGYGVSCEGANDGAIQTNVQGGKAPYTYNWNNGSNSATLSNLSEGTYTVIVEDSNGCLSTESITIDEPIALSYLYIVEDVTCYDEQDGKIELYPTGGVAPYTISWFDGSSLNYLNNLSNAYYSFTIIDANNCSTIDSIQVYEPTDLLITVDTIQPTCERINDGQIDAFIYGGTYPYSYTLNGSPLNLPLDSVAIGNYVLTVEDSSSCTKTIAFNLTPLQPSCFMIPNMYSPNYDGYNDVFKISHSSWSSYTMNIYNSIGQLVYSGSSSTAYWDGLTNGAPMPTGDYYYQLITNEGEVTYGYVTLIR